ncbi:MAG TPA: type II toxin-antitoxin system antitoxin SocA domain-containing protein, partial [Acidobacteriaceae bacterium]
PLTQINIQKLVYFAHGWHLAFKHTSLIQEPIEAWKYGPVVRRLYDAFKYFGSSPITEKATEWYMSPEGRLTSKVPNLEGISEEDDLYARSLVDSIWKKYGTLEPFKLVEITHLPESPWTKAIQERKNVISNGEIEQYFSGLIQQGQ